MLPSDPQWRENSLSSSYRKVADLVAWHHWLLTIREEKQSPDSHSFNLCWEWKEKSVFAGQKGWVHSLFTFYTQNFPKILTFFQIIFPNSTANMQKPTEKEGKTKATRKKGQQVMSPITNKNNNQLVAMREWWVPLATQQQRSLGSWHWLMPW